MKTKLTREEAEQIAAGKLPKGWEVMFSPNAAFTPTVMSRSWWSWWSIVGFFGWLFGPKPRKGGRIDVKAWRAMLRPADKPVIWLAFCAEMVKRLDRRGITAATIQVTANKKGAKFTVARKVA